MGHYIIRNPLTCFGASNGFKALNIICNWDVVPLDHTPCSVYC